MTLKITRNPGMSDFISFHEYRDIQDETERLVRKVEYLQEEYNIETEKEKEIDITDLVFT